MLNNRTTMLCCCALYTVVRTDSKRPEGHIEVEEEYEYI